MKNLEQIAEFRTKKGTVKASIDRVYYTCRNVKKYDATHVAIVGNHWSSNGGRYQLIDKLSDVRWVLHLAGVKFRNDNIAPRGGAEGEAVIVTKSAYNKFIRALADLLGIQREIKIKNVAGEIIYTYDLLSNNASLPYADLSNLDLRGADFRGLDITHTNLSNSNLEGADFRGVQMNCANLSGANLTNADMRDAHMSFAQFRGAILNCADLRSKYLETANFENADLREANLSGVNLNTAVLDYANLSNANLSGANLRGANLELADLTNTNLVNADLSDVRVTSIIVDQQVYPVGNQININK